MGFSFGGGSCCLGSGLGFYSGRKYYYYKG